MNRKLQNILITGGSGFIGSNFINLTLNDSSFKGKIINVDCLTYAGDSKNLSDIESIHAGDRYFFEKIDICDKAKISHILKKYDIDTVIHMAAESHVDRSIESPHEFLRTNVMGTFNLLACAKDFWEQRKDVVFHHVSTDEVYGALGETGFFTEKTSYDPRSPYSASKASSDHIVRAYFHTYDFPVMISNCSNNYGPRQNKEKLIPLMITNMLNGKPLPVYGEGSNIRDWIYVDDHNLGIWEILKKGKLGETYNLGGNNEVKNIDMVKTLCHHVAEKTGKDSKTYLDLITFVTDRLGHDFRYAIDNSKALNELEWKPVTSFKGGIDKTIAWYLDE